MTANWPDHYASHDATPANVTAGVGSYDDLPFLSNNATATEIPRMTGIRVYQDTIDGTCLGFKVRYWLGKSHLYFTHAISTIDTTVPNVTMTKMLFRKGEYISEYLVSADMSDPTRSIAFKFTLNDGSNSITCGNLQLGAVNQNALKVGDCDVIPIGFASQFSTSSPPYLTGLKPYVTTPGHYTAA